MSGLRTVSTTFLVFGVVGVAGVKLMKIESIDDKPVLGEGKYHSDAFKHYDKNTLTIPQIEECLNIKNHLDNSKAYAVKLETQLEGIKSAGYPNKTNVKTYNDALNHYRTHIIELNSINRRWNNLCANKRYYLDDYNRSHWKKTAEL
ncbi:hypothetical protein [Vibrio parahaemolyticus]|uniref:hypothetical protein n=1 Tax=Vibrio parahaemolyticus TaxID=670 RepID=UPI0003F9C3D7|nr:hypothetical protein [Vibrio parahaemolyticus]